MAGIPEDALAGAIHQLYDSVLDDSQFQPALTLLSHLMGDRRSMLVRWNGGLVDQPDLISTVGANGRGFETFIANYSSHYHLSDPTKFRWTTVADGDWLHEDRAHAPGVWQRSAFYCDFALGEDIVGWSALKVGAGPAGAHWAMTFMRDSDAAELDPVALEQIRRIAGPHLQRALALRDQMDVLRHTAQAGLAALDLCAMPLWLLDRSGAVRFANAAAEAYARQNGVALGVKNGRLLPRDRRQDRHWSELLAADPLTNGPQSAGLVLRNADGDPEVAQLLPLSSAVASNADWRRPLRLLVLQTRHRSACVDVLLRQLYGLTPAEVRTSRHLMRDMNTSEIAEQSGVTLDTVRSHIKALLQKTGCRRQAELIRLLEQLHAFGQRPKDRSSLFQ